MANKLEHPFDPSLKPCFSGVFDRSEEPCPRDVRKLFYRLLHQSEHVAIYLPAYRFIKQKLAEVGPMESWSWPQQDQTTTELAFLPLECGIVQFGDEHLESCLLQLAPVILIQPCWLATSSQAATSLDPLAAGVMRVYLELIQAESSRQLFESLLLSSGINLPPLSSSVFAEQEAIGECMFEFAALQLALACFPRVFFPEILGFTLAYCRSQSLLQQLQGSGTNQVLARFVVVEQGRKALALPGVNRIVDDYINTFPGQADGIKLRIQSGFSLYRNEAEHSRRYLVQQLNNPPSAFAQLAELLRRKAPVAAGHHKKIRLGGRPLDDWFSQSPFDASGFLSALKQSVYFDKGNPENSPLLKLFEFNGPMFGVLNSNEKMIVERWLIAKNAEMREITEEPDEKAVNKGSWQIESEEKSPELDYSSLGNRELYHYLVNADLYPGVLIAARQKVHKVLRFVRGFYRLPFKPYRHQAFEDYIDALYRQEVRNYQPFESTPKLSKEAYLWGIEQLAPTLLADGCWLQEVSQLRYFSNRAVGALLSKIFHDEAGNGMLAQNHPFIFRQLLNSVDIQVPPIASRKFIEYPGFIDSAFDLPVYLLAISKFPSAFLPELLGLNMAIELSGLGNIYQRLSEELTYWGIDSRIVDVHISIDNVSSGHAFLAKSAITLYLDDIGSGLGDEAVQFHWRRIFDGYCSLQSVCIGFKLALVSRYLLKRITNIHSE